MVATMQKSLQETLDAIRTHEIKTTTHFVSWSSPKGFGNLGVPCGQKKVLWHQNMPYIILGVKRLTCHHGKDQKQARRTKTMKCEEDHEMDQQKKRTRKTPSKKLDCVACIYVKEVLSFPELKTDVIKERKKKAKIVRSSLEDGIRCFLLVLPDVNLHNHPVEERKASNGGRMWQCARCGKQDRKGRVAAHILKEHIPLHQVPFHCLLCQFRCLDSNTLRDHVSQYSRHVSQEKNMRKPIDYAQFLVKAERPIHITSNDMFQVQGRLTIDLLKDKSDSENQPPGVWPSWIEPGAQASPSGPVSAKGNEARMTDLEQLIEVLEFGNTSNSETFQELQPSERIYNVSYIERAPVVNPGGAAPDNIIYEIVDAPSQSGDLSSSYDQVVEETEVLPNQDDHLYPLLNGFDRKTQSVSGPKEDPSIQTTLEDRLANIFEAGVKRITQAIDEGVKVMVEMQRATEATLQEVKRIEQNVCYIYRSVAEEKEETSTEEQQKLKTIVTKRKSTEEDEVRKQKKIKMTSNSEVTVVDVK
ncbi:uncharacterized protein LOC128226528 [Mya arenaria]|uniref:uncharacterized protein LOC128226528 n=1 Tax=Mya arenaria TaxID=6604 RepID=UPI0022E476F5|nr:uncharacterized protein LOC128226528 [Mya arenaria]